MKKTVVIIGGGIAGLEAAARLLGLGFRCVVIERKETLGGHVALWHRLFPDMTLARDVVGSLTEAASGAEIRLKTEVRSINRLKDGFSVKLSDNRTLLCDAVLIASGFKLFNAAKKEEYGYGIYDRVITNRDLESWFNGNPDGRIPSGPASVGFVHCVGSRDVKSGNTQCSKVCCMTAVKQAIEMKERFPDAEVWCFYMDLRLFGKKYEDFYIDAQKEYGIHFLRGRVSEVGETIDGRVQVKAEDTLVGKPVKITLDLLVLMSGMVCNPHISSVSDMLRLESDSDGFIRSQDNLVSINRATRPGVFLAGACTGTKTVPETLAEARAAALAINDYLSR